MRRTVAAWRTRWLGTSAASGLVLLVAGCTAPLHVAWNDTQSVIAPVRREPQDAPPQGLLTVSNDHYRFYNGDVPRTTRPPVAVYTVDGQLVAREQSPVSEGPLHVALSPGQYIVVVKRQGHWRQVQVEVQEGRETVVAEAQLDQASVAAASPSEPTTQLMAGRSGLSR